MQKMKPTDPHGNEVGLLVNGHSIPMMWCVMCLMAPPAVSVKVRSRMIFKNGIGWTVHTIADHNYAMLVIDKALEDVLAHSKDKKERRCYLRRKIVLRKHARVLTISTRIENEDRSAA